MIDLRAALGKDAFDAFMHQVALGKYNLLLGAGASADSLDRYGNTMPIGNRLRDEIAAAFQLSDADDKSLKRVYALASGKADAQGRTIAKFIKEYFTNTQPASWLEELLRIQWNSMWTLNVDDTIERAHVRAGAGARQKMTSLSWTDRHYQADRRLDELVFVHLHGKAHRAHKDGELIFDISGYTASLQEQHRWLKIFGDYYPAKPFVVIGASIDEEIDLQDVFSAGKVATLSAPSLIVLRDMDTFQESEYKNYGLIPIRATGEDFINAVTSALPEFLNKLTADEVGITEATPQESIRFLDQWKPLSMEPDPRRPAGHDLYLGHEPNWYDATHEFISRRPAVKKIRDALTKFEETSSPGAVVVFGEAFNGKTSVLLRFAHEAAQEGFRPRFFTGDSAIDVEAVLYWIHRVPKTLLIVDNASDFARDLKTVLSESRVRKLATKVVLTERFHRVQHIKDMLADERTVEVRIAPQLGEAEGENLIAKLAEKRRLGALTNMSPQRRREYFRDHDRKLFSIMASLEDGRGFKQRVSNELAKTEPRKQRHLLAAVSLASRLGYHLPFELTRTSADVASAEAQRLAEQDLSDLLEVTQGGISTRHRIFGELLIQELPIEERQSAVVRLALAVAPHVSPQSIRAGTLHYRIVRSIMGAEILEELLGSNRVLILQFYEQLEESYDWNARFWEQRALAAADAGKFEPAFSWAQQAIMRRRDAFSLTTTGKILMLRAVAEAQGGNWPTDTFERAEDFLREARQIEGNSAEYPIETFLTYISKLTRLVPHRDSSLDGQIQALWSNWFTAILGLEPSSQARLESIRKTSSANWERTWPSTELPG